MNLEPRSFSQISQEVARPTAERALAHRVDDLARRVTAFTAYADTLKLVTTAPVPEPLEARVQRTTNGAVFVKGRQYRWRRLLWVHQPTLATAACLTEALPDAVVGRLDLAVDLTTASPADAEILQTTLPHILTQKWHGKRAVVEVSRLGETTTYFARRGKGRNLVVYNRPKFTSRNGVHLEIRFETAEACQRRGIKHATDLAAVIHDPLPHILREFRLSAPDWAAIDRHIDAAVRRLRTKHTDPVWTRQRIERILARRSVTEDDTTTPTWAELRAGPAQRVLDAVNLPRDSAYPLRDPLIHLPSHRLFSPAA